MFEYNICFQVALIRDNFFHEIHDFTLMDLLLKSRSPASIFFNIQIERLLTVFSNVFNLDHQHFVSSLPYAKPTYFYIFPRYSNSLPNLLMLVYLIIETCMKLKRIKISEDIAY